MKTIVETKVGDGKAGLYVEDGNLEVKITYPLAVVTGPIDKAVDNGIDKLEAAIPGDWDKAVLEPIRAGIKAEIASLLAGL